MKSVVDEQGGYAGGVCGVIVTYNGSRWIQKCVQSLFAAGVNEVVIVDNGSTDDTVELVSKIANVHVIQNSGNRGFGVANNQGIGLALNRGAEAVGLFNQDLVVEPDAIGKMLEVFVRRPEFGLVSGFQLDYTGREIDPVFESFLPAALVRDALVREIKEVYECRFMPAAAVLLPAKVLRCVGGFDPLFFMYCEDNDLCRRVISAGFKVGVAPGARVQHWHGAVNADARNLTWMASRQYSRALLDLKYSTRGLVSGLVGLIVKWSPTIDKKLVVARMIVLWKLLRNCRKIRRALADRQAVLRGIGLDDES